jgi:hypothetical protein
VHADRVELLHQRAELGRSRRGDGQRGLAVDRREQLPPARERSAANTAGLFFYDKTERRSCSATGSVARQSVWRLPILHADPLGAVDLQLNFNALPGGQILPGTECFQIWYQLRPRAGGIQRATVATSLPVKADRP